MARTFFRCLRQASHARLDGTPGMSRREVVDLDQVARNQESAG